jgi:hypothetical protein
MVLGHTGPVKLCKLAQCHSIRNALSQLTVVPVLDALKNERAQNLLRRQSASTALRIFQSSRQITTHLLNNLLLIVKEVGMACSSGSRQSPRRINSQSAKLICSAVALDTCQLLLADLSF